MAGTDKSLDMDWWHEMFDTGGLETEGVMGIEGSPDVGRRHEDISTYGTRSYIHSHYFIVSFFDRGVKRLSVIKLPG